MPDWQTLPFAVDLSHHNGTIDWDRLAAQKPAVVFLKASERQWTDPAFERNRKAATDRGLLWLPYIFLRPDDGDRTIRYFLDLIGDKSIPAALDWEAPGVPSAVVEAWIDALEAETGRTAIAYYGLYPPAAATAKIGRCPRWFPQYPGSATASPRLPAWDGSPDPDWRKCWLVWQWSEKGGVAGISGNVDMNRLACSVEQFAAWYRTGSFDADPAAPQPSIVARPTTAQPRPIRGPGDHGDDVAELQRRLIAKGYDVGAAGADGWFGKDTEAALWRFIWAELARG